MNLDEYFSKYVDAELSAAEDAEMRAFLADNESARSEFDHAALISVAMMRESESISTPDDLFAETEALIVSKINSSKKPVVVPTTRQRSAALSLALLLCVFLVSDAIRMGDRDSQAIGSQGLSTAAVFTTPSQELCAFSVNANATSTTASLGGAKRNPDNENALASLNVPNDASEKLTSPPSAFAFIKSDVQSIGAADQSGHGSDQISGDRAGKNPNSSYAADALASSEQLRKLYIQNRLSSVQVAAQTDASDVTMASLELPTEPFPAVRTTEKPAEQIQLGTYVGNIVKSTTSASSSRHFSQSIGYPVSDGVSMGVELGTFAIVAAVPGQFGTSLSSSSADAAHKGSIAKVENANSSNGGGGSGSYGESAGLLSTERNVVWGAAFVERALVSTSDLSVKARVAVGSSDGGPLVFARAMSVLKVYGPVSLTLGTEGRMFFYDDKNTSNTDQNLQTMMSVMYGVQVKF